MPEQIIKIYGDDKVIAGFGYITINEFKCHNDGVKKYYGWMVIQINYYALKNRIK